MPNRTGATPAFALTATPVPGVENSAPRGEFTLKKLFGSRFGSEKLLGTASQFISHLPVPNEPATLGFRVPRSVLKASTVGVIAAASGPDAKKLIDRAWASPVADNTMRALVRATIPVRVLKGTASVIFFLRRLWKILRLTTSIRPPNHRVNYCSALPALLQLGGPWHALLGSDGRDASERPILDVFKAFGLDHRSLSDWYSLVSHLARVLFHKIIPTGKQGGEANDARSGPPLIGR